METRQALTKIIKTAEATGITPVFPQFDWVRFGHIALPEGKSACPTMTIKK